MYCGSKCFASFLSPASNTICQMSIKIILIISKDGGFSFCRKDSPSTLIWQTQHNDCALSKDSDQPGLPPRLIRVFACAQWVAKDPSFLHADSEDWPDWADAQADLSLSWAHMTFCWFYHEAAHTLGKSSNRSCKIFKILAKVRRLLKKTYFVPWYNIDQKEFIKISIWSMLSLIFYRVTNKGTLIQ